MRHFDYFEQIDGPQGRRDVTGRVIPGKGGGGGSGTPYYANMDKLYGAQAQAANYMLDQSMPVLPSYMQNSKQMVDQAMDGSLEKRLREQAGADAGQGLGMALDASNRNLQRYGAEFNPNMASANANNAAMTSALGRAGAMNNAALAAEDMKWNRNAGALAQATGMGSGAMQSMGSAAGGYGAAGSAMGREQALNAAGYGRFGAAVSQSAFKDGGEVIEGKARRVDKKPGLHLAMGGDAWAAYKTRNPIAAGGLANSGGTGLSSLQGAAYGAAPALIGKGLKAAMGSDTVKNAISNTYGAGRAGLERALGATHEQAAAPVVDKSFAGATGAEAGATTGAEGGAAAETAGSAAATEGAGAAAAETAAATAAETAAAEGTAATVAGTNFWNPVGWTAAAYGLGKAFDLFSDGGAVSKKPGLSSVSRKDFRPGGKVQGPGTETSDDIPAWLSKGEFVLNAEAVKMVGKGKLNELNNAGLEKRSEKKEGPGLHLATGGRRHEAQGHEPGLHLAGGGFLGGNLGIALGAAADEMKDQRRLAREDAAEARSSEQFKMAQEQFGWQRDDQVDKDRIRKAEQALSEKYRPMFESAAKGDYSFAPSLVGSYNKQEGAFNDGHTAMMQSTPQGDVLHVAGPDNKIIRSTQLNPQSANEMLQQAYMLERSGIGAPQMKEYADYGLKLGDQRIKQDTLDATRQHYQRNDETMNQYRTDQGRLIDEKIRTGNWGMLGLHQAQEHRGGDPLTTAQQSRNQQIEISRRKLAGMSPDEVKSKTQKFLDTGRDNKAFDPAIAQHARFAAMRKYGADDWYDEQGEDHGTGGQEPPSMSDRFTADPAMKGFKLGNQTPRGFEVFNSAGKLIGHYQ